MGLIRRYSSVMHGNYRTACLKYGLYMGLAFSFVLFFRWLIVLPASQPMGIVENVLQFGLMLAFVAMYRGSLCEKKITFKEAYIVGLGSAVVGAIIYGLFMYMYIMYMDPDMQTRCLEIQKAADTKGEFSPKQLAQLVRPSYIAFSSILLNSVMAVIWSLVAALVLSNEKAALKKKGNKKANRH